MNACRLMLCSLLVAACSYTEPSAELIRLFGEHCESLGYEPGSPEYNECVIAVGAKK